MNGELQQGVIEQKENHVGAVIGFKTHKGEQVHARVASSFISHDQAALNLKELGNDSFEELAEKGRKAWNEVLGRIEVSGGNLDQYRTFYSCLYRATLFPQKHYEMERLFIIVRIPELLRKDIFTQEPDFGILSVVCFRY